MLFPDDALFDHELTALAEEIASHAVPPIEPLPCDRWVARSCFQKAIRRAEPALAIRALANLFEHDRRSMWRTLVIVACEDVGVANVELLSQIVAAQRNRGWRGSVGGDWRVAAELVRQMALGNHCQAACDLLLKATNDPAFQGFRDIALHADMSDLATWLADNSRPVTEQGIAALAAGGGLAEGQTYHDPAAVLDILAELGRNSHVVATCRTAWKISRNPMALLLPLAWQAWAEAAEVAVVHDQQPIVQLISGVPGYALDQFTRRGNMVSRALLQANPEMRGRLDAAGVKANEYATTIGDLIFLQEGGLLCRRAVWSAGDELRLPHRWLPAVPRLGPHLGGLLRLIEAKTAQIAQLRLAYLSTLVS